MSECCKPCLQVGAPAPSFKGRAVVGNEMVDLEYEKGVLKVGDETIKGKYVVLFYYPLDFTFVCPTEILAFHDKISAFKEIGAEVIGVSVDSPYTHLAWKNTPRNQGGLGQLDFPLLSDLGGKNASAYEVLLEGGVAARGVFIIDEQGTLQSYTVNNLGVGRNVDEIIRLIQGFQFVAKHGEVCPANWKPGADTMKPDPEGSKDYFKKVK